MTRKTYKIKLPFDVLHVSADLEQASAPIIINDASSI